MQADAQKLKNDPVLPDPPALYLALDLSNRSWKLAFSSGLGQRARIRTIPARDLQALTTEVNSARTRLRLPDSAPLISCFEGQPASVGGPQFTRLKRTPRVRVLDK